MTTKHLSILVAAVLAAITLFSSSAYARNEFVNGIFKEGQRINPIQGDLGVAKYRMIVPQGDPRAGKPQYFEKCWEAPGGFNCKYEVLFNGQTQPGAHNHQRHANVDDNDHDGNVTTIPDDWAGKFASATKDGPTWFATVTVNGKQTVETYKVCAEGEGKHGFGWYCDPDA